MDDSAAEKPSPRWALAGLSLSMLLPSLGTSIANVALPTLSETFAVSFQEVQWIVLAYLLSVTTVIVCVGRLGDLFGRRRLLLFGIALFAIASMLCGLAPSFSLLIAARAAQGVGAAVMMALTMALVSEAVPRSKTGRVIGLLGTMSAIGTALGPSLGGVLIAGLGWKAIFLVNVPLGVLAFSLVHRWVPAEPAMERFGRPRFDVPGTILLSFTLGSFALAMTSGRGSFKLVNGVLLLAAVLGGGLLLRVEARTPSPLLPLAVLRGRDLVGSLVTSALVATVLMATLVVGPFYLSGALGLGLAQMGMVMSVGPLVAALTGAPAGHLVDRFGAPPMIILGLIAITAGTSVLSVAPTELGIAGYVAPIMVVTAGYALFQTANNTAVMRDVRAEQRGVISAMLNLSRNVGLISGASIMGAIFAYASGARDVATMPPETAATAMRITFAVATALAGASLLIVDWSRSALATLRQFPISLCRR